MNKLDPNAKRTTFYEENIQGTFEGYAHPDFHGALLTEEETIDVLDRLKSATPGNMSWCWDGLYGERDRFLHLFCDQGQWRTNGAYPKVGTIDGDPVFNVGSGWVTLEQR